MDINNKIFTLTQQADAEKPSLFPFPFSFHLVFVCICVLFFAYRFTAQKRPYQAIMSVAVLASMAIWLSESKSLYYAIGILELVLILAAFVTALIFKAPQTDDDDLTDDPDSEDESNENDGDETDTDEDNTSDENSDDTDDEDTAIMSATTVNNTLNM